MVKTRGQPPTFLGFTSRPRLLQRRLQSRLLSCTLRHAIKRPVMLNNSEIVQAIEQRAPISSERLLPLIYNQLLLLARQRLTQYNSDNSFDSCDLVHEAYLRLKADGRQWDHPGHFFAAAADEMRRILIDHKRRMRRVKHGGDRIRVELPEPSQSGSLELEDLLALQEALEALQQKSAKKAELVKLRYFAGLTLDEAAALLQISRTTANRYWSFSRDWLFNRLQDHSPQPAGEPEPPAVDQPGITASDRLPTHSARPIQHAIDSAKLLEATGMRCSKRVHLLCLGSSERRPSHRR